jgi:hypothetical protein
LGDNKSSFLKKRRKGIVLAEKSSERKRNKECSILAYIMVPLRLFFTSVLAGFSRKFHPSNADHSKMRQQLRKGEGHVVHPRQYKQKNIKKGMDERALLIYAGNQCKADWY